MLNILQYKTPRVICKRPIDKPENVQIAQKTRRDLQ